MRNPARLWLRMEGLAVLGVTLLLYTRGEYSWLLFAVLFLLPDLTFAGYLAGPRTGSIIYNALHSYVGPLALAAALLITAGPLAVPLIWASHIGFDRTLGYGLKHPTEFGDTHLGRIGRG